MPQQVESIADKVPLIAGLSCPHTDIQRVEAIWDVNARKTVRIFECRHCRKLIWED